MPSYVWDGETLPVPIEDIADSHAGLLVRDVEDLTAAPGAPSLQENQSLSGLLLARSGGNLGQRGRSAPMADAAAVHNCP